VHVLVRSALLGAAAGGRSFTPIAVLALTAPSSSTDQPDRTLSRPWARRTAVAVAAAELGGDKLPQTPPRTTVAPLIGRVGAGAGSGIIVARRAGAREVPTIALAAVVAAAASAATTLAGPAWRKLAARRFGRDLPGAVIEDAASAGLAVLAVQL
jgi:uncharacterized membrane protein